MKIDQDYSGEAPRGGEPDAAAESATDPVGSAPATGRTESGYRYLGGASSATAYHTRFPQWFHAFLLLLAVCVMALALLAVVSWKFESADDQPRFRLIAADRSEFLTEPAVQFTSQDRQRLSGALNSDAERDVREVADRRELEQALADALLTTGSPTRVLYLQLAGATAEGQSFLLAQNSDPRSPATGLTVRQLVQLLADAARSETASCENVLLILDLCSTPHNLLTGTLASQFAHDLSSQLTESRTAGPLPNLVVICSTGSAQRRTVSNTLSGSPFALCVRYALDGGARADVRSPRSTQADQIVSAAELADFARGAVANWTLRNRGRAQIPLTIQFGEDFPVRDVNPEVSFTGLLHPEPLEDDVTSDGKTAVAAVGETPDSSPDAPGSESERGASTVIPTELRAAFRDVLDARRRRDRLAHTSALDRRSIHFAFLDHTLYRAEVALLGGKPERAAAFVADLTKVFDQLESLEGDDAANASDPASADDAAGRVEQADGHAQADSPSEAEETGDASAAGGVSTKRTTDRVDRALAEPTDAHLTELLSLDTADARLLLILAAATRVDNAWRDPELVAKAIALRRQADRIGRSVSPLLLEFLQDALATADQTRVRSEIAVISGRTHEARALAASARSAYDAVSEQEAEMQEQLRTLQQSLLAMPPVLDWLCTLEHAGQSAVKEAELIAPCLDSIIVFCDAPSRDTLRRAAVFCDGLQRSVNQSALEALALRDWSRMTAILRLPVLDVAVRERLLRNLVSFEDGIRFRAGGPVSTPPGPAKPPCVGQLHAYIRHIATLQAACSPTRDDRMLGGRRIGPLLESLQRWKRVTASPRGAGDAPAASEVRDATEEVQAAFQQWVLDVQRYPLRLRELQAVGTATQWHTRCLSLSLAFWTGARSQTLALQDAVMENLWANASAERTDWLAREQQRLERRLPHPWIDTASTQGPMGPWQGPNPVFEVTSDTDLRVDPGTSQSVTLALRALRSFDPETPVALVWEWNHHDFPLQIAIDSREAENGRLRIPLSTPVALNEQVLTLSIAPEATSSGAGPSAAFTGEVPVGVRVETNERNYWLPVRLTVVDAEAPAARLVFKWDDAVVPNRRIDLLPNERIPISLELVVDQPLAEPCRLEFLGVGEPQSVRLAETSNQPGTYPIAPPEGFAVPFQGDLVAVELFSGTRRLDRVELRAAILDLAQCFRPDVRFNPATRRLSATLTRLQRSDVNGPVAMELTAAGAESVSVGGQAAATLQTGAEQVTADLRFPADFGLVSQAELAVSGVPRAFRFSFAEDHLQGQLDRELRLQFTAPQAFSRWQYRSGHRVLPVRLQADGGEEVALRIGVDLDRNGRLDDYEVQLARPYWFGRDKALHLEPDASGAAWQVRASVNDVEADVDVTGLVGRQTLAVSAADDGQRLTADLPVFLLREAPPLQILWPRPSAPQSANQPLSITLQTDRQLLEAIDVVQVGFDANADGELADDELVVPLGEPAEGTLRFGQSDRLNLQLPLPENAAETLRLLARTRSQVQREPSAKDPGVGAGPSTTEDGGSDASDAAATADAPPELVSEPVRAAFPLTTRGRIQGVVVTADGTPQSEVRIALGRVNLTVTDAAGRFELPPIPAGTYTVTARKGSRSAVSLVTVKAAEATDVKLTLYIR